MTYNQAVTKAIRLAKKTDRPWSVVYDGLDAMPNGYDVADDEEMATFYAGSDAAYCTDD